LPPLLFIKTMEPSLHLINDFLDKLFIYGPFWIYLALFAALFIENIFPPFPGDFFTLAGGALAAAGRLNMFFVFLTVYLGGIASIMLIYYFGYTYGRAFFIRKNYRLFSSDDILRLEAWFQRRGALLLLLNRFIIGARSAAALVTGISHYDSAKTFVYISISFWIFNGLLLFGSYIFVVNLETIIRYFHVYEKVAWSIVILIVASLIFIKLRRTKING
jgi:membrane protein DedA with SNARE-associated domain